MVRENRNHNQFCGSPEIRHSPPSAPAPVSFYFRGKMTETENELYSKVKLLVWLINIIVLISILATMRKHGM